MDDLPNSPTPPPEVAELRAECQALRQMLGSILILLIVVSGTLTIFMARQWKWSKNDVQAARQQTEAMVAEYNRGAGQMQDFVRRLAEYSRAHPDFAPIAAKYRLQDVLTNSAAAPAPPTPTPMKK